METEVPKKERPKFKLTIKPIRGTLLTDEIDFNETVIANGEVFNPVDTSLPGPLTHKKFMVSKNYRENSDKKSIGSNSSHEEGTATKTFYTRTINFGLGCSCQKILHYLVRPLLI